MQCDFMFKWNEKWFAQFSSRINIRLFLLMLLKVQWNVVLFPYFRRCEVYLTKLARCYLKSIKSVY